MLIYPLSLVISLIILIPNLLFFGSKPNHLPEGVAEKENPLFTIAEGLGRMGVFILPVFSTIHIQHLYEFIALSGMLIFIILYYAGWVRYFALKREYKLLFSPIIGIPVPMALSPIIYFLFASVVLHSPYLFISTVILGIGHVPVSLNTYYRTK